MNRVLGDLQAVDDFIAYVTSCLESNIKEEVDIFANRRDIGFNKKTGRLGILLPEHIVDFGISAGTQENG